MKSSHFFRILYKLLIKIGKFYKNLDILNKLSVMSWSRDLPIT